VGFDIYMHEGYLQGILNSCLSLMM